MSHSWTPLHARIHRTIRHRHLLQENQSILIAVSGGQDSLCLAQLMIDLRSRWNWQLAIAHCDHRWRSDSEENAQHVATLAEKWDLPFYLKIADSIPSNEAAAREWRYAQLQSIEGFSAIVTGHTASDRAETLLFNLIRGSGADGLRSLNWTRSLSPTQTLIRPLLELIRSQTGEFCRDRNLEIWEDSTNSELKYSRNRIRQELIPDLRTYNLQVEHHLAQTIELLSADVDYLESVASELYEKANSPDGLDRRTLQQTAIALQRRVIRQFLARSLNFSPNFEQVEKCVALITAPNRSRTDPVKGTTIAEVTGDFIQLRSL
ncbi:tRNA lysidine(34) synthetase TilS [Leptolyngbya sp. NIES-2104]|uniref:tRNA lysidine(34) synthetase TilS n=1 Tax=Leptolyngbya sp. NIES-2104 TaxID=1552121 RepID=UPI0006EC6079|nr:tRNA lysidine(34) synthetase TilS [Leptolyngbya sp. NIES-2104]GAP93519.1 tRNA (Ile)-lysidine synthetase [Leptolyngbya sp. NIES-2104]